MGGKFSEILLLYCHVYSGLESTCTHTFVSFDALACICNDVSAIEDEVMQ